MTNTTTKISFQHVHACSTRPSIIEM